CTRSNCGMLICVSGGVSGLCTCIFAASVLVIQSHCSVLYILFVESNKIQSAAPPLSAFQQYRRLHRVRRNWELGNFTTSVRASSGLVGTGCVQGNSQECCTKWCCSFVALVLRSMFCSVICLSLVNVA